MLRYLSSEIGRGMTASCVVAYSPTAWASPGAIEPIGDDGGATRFALLIGASKRPLDLQPPKIIDATRRTIGRIRRDRVDHAPGQHDDRANAAAGALVLAATGDTAAAAEIRRWALSVGADEPLWPASCHVASDAFPRP